MNQKADRDHANILYIKVIASIKLSWKLKRNEQYLKRGGKIQANCWLKTDALNNHLLC